MDIAIEKAEQKIEYLSRDEEPMRIYYERERSLHERAKNKKDLINVIVFIRFFSLLFNLIAGFDTECKGSISFRETELSNLNSSELCNYRRDYIGFIFQEYNLISDNYP